MKTLKAQSSTATLMMDWTGHETHCRYTRPALASGRQFPFKRRRKGRAAGPGEIEQVHEIGVKAQIGVQPNRVGGDFFQCVSRSSRGQEQQVGALPDGLGLTPQFFQAILRRKGVASA